MTRIVEFVSFRVREGKVPAFMTARRAAIDAVKRAHPQLEAVPVLAEHADGTWTDVWIYRSAEAAQRAAESAGDLPAFVAMADLLEDVVITEGSVAERNDILRENAS